MKFTPDWECLSEWQLQSFVLSVLWNFTVKFSPYKTNQPEPHVTVTPSADLGLEMVT